MENTLNSSEALYGFCAWLTTREKVITMGSSHECSHVVDVIETFIQTNNLPKVRDNWTDYLTHPKEN